jgi:predicted nucleic acid-binding protein
MRIANTGGANDLSGSNYLIRGVAQGSAEAGELVAWIKAGEILITPMLAWFEFICGPVTHGQQTAMRAFLTEIVPFSEAQAIEAARLFNAIKRKRSHRVDAMIAGTAIIANARLATQNLADFKPFAAHGLLLA